MLEKFIQKYGAPAGVLSLIIAALLWGGEYVVAKDVLNLIEPNWSNAIRTFFTSVLALVIWRKQFARATRQDWRRGAVCGSLFGLAFALQIMGLKMINAGINAFISSAYVVLVPFMVWCIEKKRPPSKVFVSAFVGILGVSIMSVTGFSTGSLSIGTGELLSLLSAVGYGGAIVAADYYTKKTSVEFITGCQFLFTFVIAVIFAVIMEVPPRIVMTPSILLEFLYLIICGTFITQLLFTIGVKYASANQAGVIFPLESVSATILGCLFLHEQLKVVQVIGGILIVAAIVISSITRKKSSDL
ncbi:DMT family transporter [Ihubacter massiliensis]|uniref:DMT family transporter n=1 Tax=Hominibacterium faecale TaxID=2839743 RepID=A0A9J6QYU7_9FIRM|nr:MULTISPECIES: DMT family transporter [Eubacteriales Family XIII. Incertae Sedis]MCI7303085.1 DMT family transporter [Clostridia bacterium]MDE8734475.1 DMT family transporter [Eubacteriales bacterium DFI.9.88]MDY3012359.1 DMT family transporter [Clostridiales Family XIII bacterium]MCO7123538.1 DMT family transporter [Ihubacter massiliensis]MCU7380634.1 DMT family transporter [Hominibacterium faecale]